MAILTLFWNFYVQKKSPDTLFVISFFYNVSFLFPM